MNRNIKIINKLQKIVSEKPYEYQAVSDLFEMARIVEQDDPKLAHSINKDLRDLIPRQVRNIKNDLETREKFYFLNKRCLLFDAKVDFDAYMQYIEYDREPEKRFYLPRRKQIFPIVQALQDLEDDKLDLLTISTPPGVGKAQPLYSKVLTPKGFVKMGSLSIGDDIISGEGNIAKVVGIFPQGKRDVYKVTFDDGSFTECSDEHLWKVQTRDDRNKKRYGENGRYRIVELKDMMENIKVENQSRCNYSIDYVKPVCFKKRKLRIHPYVLGVILGDGSISSGNLSITSKDESLITHVERLLPKGDVLEGNKEYNYRIKKSDVSVRDERGWMVKTKTQQALEYYGLFGLTSKEKFIPIDYLLSDIEDRRELLRGLLDTDGYAGGHYVEYTTVSDKLAEGVKFLVQSLGGFVKTKIKQTSYYKNGKRINCNPANVLHIQFASVDPKPFHLRRKNENYKPKREVLKRFITSIEYVGKEECQCIMIDDPSHLYITDDFIITHNTTLGIFFLTWVMGKYPASCNLASAHSGMLTNSFYDGVLSTITDPEYLWADVFPGISIVGTNSKEGTVDLEKRKRFKTLTCRSIDGSLTGATRCEKYLYADDLVSGIEEAMSKDRLDKLWEKYTNDLKSRKKLDCKEIHIATRWSVQDVIGRLERQYDGDSRARFLSFPALNENDESNFDYDYGVGFDTKYFWDMRESLDDVSWRCLFMNEPIEREGLLYHEDDLRRYFELPKEEPDAIIAVCDTKDKGKDYAFLPVAYVYGQDYYIDDCVCDNGNPDIVDARLVDILLRHEVQMCRFESNSAGGRIAEKVQEEVKGKNGITHITTKYTTQNKETKIIVNSPWVKEHCLFKHSSGYQKSSDYGRMINFLCMWTMAGKNKHDDVPDGMAMLAEYAQSLDGAKVEVFQRPF
jgi:predicted phage terminase large subunit-like protein